MTMSRQQLLHLINTKGNGDWKNIHDITFNTLNPVNLREYGIGIDGGIPGKGIDFVDEDLGNGEYLTGFYITGLLPPTMRFSNNEFTEAFMPADIIDRISFKVDASNFPTYATPMNK